MYEGKSDKTPKNDTDLKLIASTLRVYLEKLDREIKNIEVFIPEKQDRNPRKHELAQAEGIRYAARELLKVLGMKTTWLEETQMAEKQSKGYNNFSYDDPDGTFYFGYFKSKKAFVDAYLGETGNWGSRSERGWVNERVGTFDEGKYGVEAWVNLEKLCKKELLE
ncbi:MAG: hypothetical protein ABSA11_15765 [Candidatus Bathyarchaeia archaeon]|jgi:hypothetical protein